MPTVRRGKTIFLIHSQRTRDTGARSSGVPSTLIHRLGEILDAPPRHPCQLGEDSARRLPARPLLRPLDGAEPQPLQRLLGLTTLVLEQLPRRRVRRRPQALPVRARVSQHPPPHRHPTGRSR